MLGYLEEYKIQHNYRHSDNNKDFNSITDSSISKPYRVYETEEIISSISWWPKTLSFKQMLITSHQNGSLEILSLKERIPIDWNPNGSILFVNGCYFKEVLLSSLKNEEIYDISYEMKNRAIKGYSMDVSFLLKNISRNFFYRLKLIKNFLNLLLINNFQFYGNGCLIIVYFFL